MKTVILSDTHLSSKVYRRKFNYLKSIIEDADRVVIAGDFWDGFLTSFDKFVNSKWQALFPLLLERQAVYLYGNHDRPEWCDERVSLFSVEHGMDTTITTATQSYHITHGHTVFTSMEDKYPFLNRKVPLRIGSNIDLIHKYVWGKSFLKEGSKINRPMSEWASNNLPDDRILITGHSHYPEMDLDSRFVNSGFIGLGYGSYAIVDASGPQIIKERY
jgi:predicted phosphodiesterase